ncbi:hypothetical protein AG0111_0g8644 [Alternaria gaisen]|uniref:Uncharacterized protein n=1 Tax=Alternaria gaisen TaxID=167740 RepID=A0ACB6FGT9_9PLEO|nr:hypothetical protein AG0111_0g8644 [Alternaria gaisen]
MSAQQESLSHWVTKLNDTLFIQPSDELALEAINQQVDQSLVTKINHEVYNYDQFKQGLQYVRSTCTSIQDEFSIVLQWENKERPDGVVAVLSKWRTKDKASGKETTKSNVILWEVKWIDGKRKLTGQTEVEVA